MRQDRWRRWRRGLLSWLLGRLLHGGLLGALQKVTVMVNNATSFFSVPSQGGKNIDLLGKIWIWCSVPLLL